MDIKSIHQQEVKIAKVFSINLRALEFLKIQTRCSSIVSFLEYGRNNHVFKETT